MKQKIFAADPNFIETYLNRRESALEELKTRADISDLFKTPENPVDEIMEIKGNTAFITISGPLSMCGPDWIDKLFGYGGASYNTIIQAVNQAADDSSIENIVLLVNTPGGDLDGADVTWQAISAACNKKRVSTHVSGMLASAGYYICCPTKIYATAKTDSIGSIGVVIAGYDETGKLDQLGVKRWKILSQNAPKKQADFSTKQGRDTLQTMVDAQERNFYASISQSRGVTPDYIAQNFGQGALLVASDPSPDAQSAIKSKMIDGFVSLDGEEVLSFDLPDTQPEDDPEGACKKKQSEANAKTPACAGENNRQEAKKMNLAEFLAQGPAAQAEIDKVKADAVAGVTKANEAKVTKCAAIIESDVYSKPVKMQAVKVLKGESEISALDAAITISDALSEQSKNAAAAVEQNAQLETVPAKPQTDQAAADENAWREKCKAAAKRLGGK